MPEMRKERSAATVDVSLDNVEVNVAQPTAGVQKARRWETRATALTIPAGAYEVSVYHSDPLGGAATVAGEILDNIGDVYAKNAQSDHTTNTQDFVPEVQIQNPDGVLLTISLSYPSASPVNPLAI